ncbi:MAG: DUF3575 domain-containing protein [Ferruginibacter sp.]
MYFHRLCFVFTLSLFVCFNAKSQPAKGQINIRTNLLSWLEPNAGGPVLGLEYFINKRFSIGTDAGFIFYNIAKSEDDNLANPIGFKIKPEVRYYLYKKNKPDPTRLFFAVEGLYLNTRTTNFNNLPIRDNNGNIVYYYIGGFPEYKKVVGGNLKAGLQIPRFISKRMMIEFYAGIGIRVKTYSFGDVPNGAVISDRFQSRFLLNTDIDGSYPSIAGGFKLIYKLKN